MPRMLNLANPRGGRFFAPAGAGGGGGGAAYRYYRINISNNSGAGNATVVKLDLRTEIDGSDITGSGTASASESHPSHPPAGAFDNDTDTRWSVPKGDLPAWLEYDLGAGNDASVVQYAVTGAAYNLESITDWIFQGSVDGAAWDDLHTVTEETDWTGWEIRTFTIS